MGYARVSTAHQALGDSLDAQEDAIRAWASGSERELVNCFRDEGRSGVLGEAERPGLLAALRLLADGDADVLAVHRLDRLARALHVQEAVLSRAWEAGGRVFEVVGDREVLQDDPEDPMRAFTRQIMGAAAQLDRGMVVARLQGGRRRRAAQGGYTGGWDAFGYNRVGSTVEPNPEEQRVLERIAQQRATGETFRSIAADLNRSGIRAKNGGPWSHTSVRAVLLRKERREAA